MSPFETTMMQNFWTFNGGVALISLIVLGYMARSLRPGYLISIAGLVAAIVVSTILAACAIALVGAFYSSNFLRTAVEQPLGAITWSFQNGPEFGLLGQIVGIIGFIVLRVRRSQNRQISAEH